MPAAAYRAGLVMRSITRDVGATTSTATTTSRGARQPLRLASANPTCRSGRKLRRRVKRSSTPCTTSYSRGQIERSLAPSRPTTFWCTGPGSGPSGTTPSTSSRCRPCARRWSRSSVVQPPGGGSSQSISEVIRQAGYSGWARLALAAPTRQDGAYGRGTGYGAGQGPRDHVEEDDEEGRHPAVPGCGAGPAAALARRDRVARGELHGLHAVRPGVPRLVHLHRLAQGGGRRPRCGPASPAQRAGPVRHRLLPVHVLRDLHRGVPVRRALLDPRVRVRRVRHPEPAAREGPPGRGDGDG